MDVSAVCSNFEMELPEKLKLRLGEDGIAQLKDWLISYLKQGQNLEDSIEKNSGRDLV